jgi:hypothetical protein
MEGGRGRSRQSSRYRPVAVFAFAVLCCALAFTLFQLTRRARFTLDLDISSPAPCRLQAAYDMGGGFDGHPSPAVALEGRPSEIQNISLDLPKGTLFAVRLRFDPLAGASLLRRAEIHGARGALGPLAIAESDGSALVLKPSEPFDYSRAKAAAKIPVILFGNGILIALASLAYAIRRPLDRLWRSVRTLVQRANSQIEPFAQRFSVPGFIRFDAPAIWFYVACVAAFAIGSLANLNGSSAGVFASDFQYGPPQKPLLGMARGIRADEWGYHTPDILNQALRKDRFAFERTALGGHGISLLGNVPIRHVSTLFRPQFWAFFFLPAARAYAVFWQCKALFLLVGVFTWLLLISGNTFWSAVGALWYFLSPFTQWTYSWTSLLPEMVGLACLIMVLFCFLTVGRNRIALCAASLALAACVINFVLCGYPPHLIPLCWLMAIFVAFWCPAHREAIARPEGRRARLLAILVAGLIVAAVGLSVFADVRGAIVAEAQTIYPGHRNLSGGANLSPATILTHFMQWTEAEHRYPAGMTDICEAAGFLWLAPFTVFWFLRAELRRTQLAVAAPLLCVFLFLGAWTILPIPAVLGKPFGLDRTFSTRCLPALGLVNVAIVAFFMASRRLPAGPRDGPWRSLFRGLQILAPFGLLLFAVNRLNGSYFSAPELALDVCLGAATILFLLEGRKFALAAMLIVPQALFFGAVNPVGRGLDVITSSPLSRFVRSHPAVLDGKWMVFGDAPGASGFLTATGCDVYTGLAYLPDIDHFPMFASAGLDLNVLNRNGYRTASLIDADTGSWVELLDVGFLRWHVSPFDPLVRNLGIRYFAFTERPPGEVASRLAALSGEPVGTFWLYRTD